MERCGNLSNSSNCTDYQSMPSITAFAIVFLIASVPLTIFNGLIAILLLQSTSVAIQVRVPLINLLVETIIANTVSFCIGVISVAIALSDATEPPLPLCQFGLWVYNVTLVVRLLGLLIFSVLMFQTVACSRRKVRAKWMMCSLVASWVIAVPSSIHLLVPGIVGFRFVGGIACFLTEGSPEYQVVRLTYNILWLVIACFVPLLLCICVLLGTLCYIKRHTIPEEAQYKKALAKFAAFLITGNVLTVLGTVMPRILSEIVPSTKSGNSVGVYIIYIMIFLSRIPTPILIAVFLKPVRKRLCHLICSKYRRNNVTIPMQHAETPL